MTKQSLLVLFACSFVASNVGCWPTTNISGPDSTAADSNPKEEPEPESEEESPAAALCGNGRAEGDECCDQEDLRDKEYCNDIRGVEFHGKVVCNEDCTCNLSHCRKYRVPTVPSPGGDDCDCTQQPSTKVEGFNLGTESPTHYRLKPINVLFQS